MTISPSRPTASSRGAALSRRAAGVRGAVLSRRAARVRGAALSRRAAASLAAVAVGLALLAGCSSEGASTDCGLDSCTVTFDRGVEASANILGVEARLIGAQDDEVTLEVAGEQLSLTVGEAATQVGGLNVSVQSADETTVVVLIER